MLYPHTKSYLLIYGCPESPTIQGFTSIMAMFTSIARLLLNTLDSMATPCSVKA